jgi:drug/metabolite transporter (DMT)-like permease
MTRSGSGETINPTGVLLSLGSATVYALFIVIINRSKSISSISNPLLTFYTLLTGAFIFFGKIIFSNSGITTGIEGCAAWTNLIGLAIFPTIISTATLAISTRNIGATKASVLGVFEPITAILVGTLAFGEALTPNIIIGIMLSIGAITFMIITTKR